MTKSRKKRGGDKLVSSCSMPGASCPKVTAASGSLMQMTKAGIKLTNQNAKNQSSMNSAMAKGGGNAEKKEEEEECNCPQPAAGSGGSISAGASSAGKNMCTGTKHALQQHASSTYDSQAKDLNINPPCDPFSGSCPSSGGGKRKRRRRKRRKLVKKLVIEEEKQEESERVADADNRFIYNLYIYKWQHP